MPKAPNKKAVPKKAVPKPVPGKKAIFGNPKFKKAMPKKAMPKKTLPKKLVKVDPQIAINEALGKKLYELADREAITVRDCVRLFHTIEKPTLKASQLTPPVIAYARVLTTAAENSLRMRVTRLNAYYVRKGIQDKPKTATLAS